VAAAAALDDTGHLTRSREMNASGREYLYRELEALGLSVVRSQANFIFVQVGRDSKEIFEALLKTGIIIRPGYVFGYPDYIRLTVGLPEENVRLVAALKTILGK
jgi:histidinol-phosphate aminotransferase